jgi:threonine dehydratase
MATAAVGERPFAIIRQHVDDIVTVSEQEIWDAMGLIMSRTKQVIEPSGAVATAAALFHKIDLAGKKVVSMLCGGNLDFSIFARRTP